MAETETVTLNLDGTYVQGANKAATASERLIEVLDKLSNSLEKSKQAAGEHGKKIQEIKDPAEIARNALDGVSAGLKGMAAAIKGGDAKGAIEGLTESLAGAATLLDLIVPGLGQVVSAVIKVGGAFTAVTVGIIQSGVEMALEVNAMNASLEATFDALGKGPDAGKKTVEMLDDVKRTLPQSRDELAKWTREIEKAGVTDLSKVRSELLATASAQAILGEEGPAAYEKISRKVHDAIEGHHKLSINSKELTRTIGTNLADAIAKKMGMSLEVLEQKLKAGTVDATKFGNAMEETFIEKGGKGLDAMWLKTGGITKKLKESFGELFSGVDTAPITDAMRNLLGLFDQANPSGQAMKTTFTDVFNSLVKDIAWAIVEGEVMFLELEVFALSTKLAFKPLLEIIQDIGNALKFVGTAVGVITPPGAPPAPPKSVQEMKFDAVSTIVQGPLSLLTGKIGNSGVDIGNALSTGMIVGILGALGLIKQAGHQAGEAGAQGAREGAQVHSPSRLTRQVGLMMGEGIGVGMTDSIAPARAGRQIVGNALGGMVGQSLTAPATNQNSSGGISISGLTIQITAPHGVTDATSLSASALVIAVERLQLASGR